MCQFNGHRHHVWLLVPGCSWGTWGCSREGPDEGPGFVALTSMMGGEGDEYMNTMMSGTCEFQKEIK